MLQSSGADGDDASEIEGEVVIDDSVERNGDEEFADAIRLEQHYEDTPLPPEPEHGVERPVTRK